MSSWWLRKGWEQDISYAYDPYHAFRREAGRKYLWIGVSSQTQAFSADSVLYSAPTYPPHAHEPVVVSGKSERERRNIKQSGQERSKKPVPGKSYYCIVHYTLSTLSLASSFTQFIVSRVSCGMVEHLLQFLWTFYWRHVL